MRMAVMSAEAATLRVALLPRAGVGVDVVLIGLGSALIAASAQISIALPFTPVPITGQTFTVLLVGVSLGSLRGGASGLFYLLLGLVGLPVYADGGAGMAVISGASGGYLISFPFVAALTGWLAERGWDRRFSSAVGAMLTGNVLIYLVGLPWLAAVLNTSLEKTLEYGLYPFVPGDIFKLYLAGALLPITWRFVGGVRQKPEAQGDW
jgi:biotin transport system substrate-specific component